MKNGIFMLILLCFSLFSNAQIEPPIGQALVPISPKYILKTNLTSYAFTTINLNFETKVHPSMSVGLLTAYMLPRVYDLSAAVEPETDDETFYYSGEIEPSGYFITPYFRYYPTGAMTGFYAETFLRYYNVEYKVPYDFENNDGKQYKGNMDGTADGFGGGVVLGGQFNLSPKIYLDIFIGAGVASGNAHLLTNDPNLTSEDFAEIKQALDENKDSLVDIKIIGNTLSKATADANATSAWADIESELFPLFRGGISLGFGF